MSPFSDTCPEAVPIHGAFPRLGRRWPSAWGGARISSARGFDGRAVGDELPIRLRVLLSAAEDAISAPAFRPGDVLHSREGLTIEVRQHGRGKSGRCSPTPCCIEPNRWHRLSGLVH